MFYSNGIRSIALGICAASVLSASAVTTASAEGYIANHDAYVISVESWDSLNNRKWPAYYSQQVGEIPHDGQFVWVQRCIYKEYASDWCKVNYDGQWGWVNSRYLVQH